MKATNFYDTELHHSHDFNMLLQYNDIVTIQPWQSSLLTQAVPLRFHMEKSI